MLQGDLPDLIRSKLISWFPSLSRRQLASQVDDDEVPLSELRFSFNGFGPPHHSWALFQELRYISMIHDTGNTFFLESWRYY
jgi:hypothetical protein